MSGDCISDNPLIVSLQPAEPVRDVLVVGAGAAGLAAAIFIRRQNRERRVLVLDSARKPGAKMLVSGGGRCNVTNAIVTERDFWGGRSTIVRKVLRALTVAETRAFFAELGVPLHEEPDGKLFPDSHRARDVLDALLREGERVGVELLANHRVHRIRREGDLFCADTVGGEFRARHVVLATGGASLPKSGSDGAGYDMARALGHTIVPTTPALVPLILDDAEPLHRRLSGVSHDAELAVWIEGKVAIRLDGSLLWTHFGISGPVALNMSRHWARAKIETEHVRVALSFLPSKTFEAADEQLRELIAARPRASISAALGTILPAAVADSLLRHVGIDTDAPGSQLSRVDRRRLAHALTEYELPITGTRGYNFAEATAGGVDLAEINPSTMESRRCRGLYLVGEVLDVDGRIGGFNFQWAWSSARVAALSIARRGS